MAEPNKLVISNKLVGRDAEVKTLQKIYREIRDQPGARGAAENTPGSNKSNAKAVYVKGLSGTGKSRLVTDALQSLVENDGGYFCTGKFDVNRSLRPFSAFSDALNDLCFKARRHIEGNDEAKAKLSQLMKPEHSRTMISMVPNMKYLLRIVQPINSATNEHGKELLHQASVSSSLGWASNRTPPYLPGSRSFDGDNSFSICSSATGRSEPMVISNLLRPCQSYSRSCLENMSMHA